jgi:glycosyltransferase involved in cell wall biosynthesis
MLSIVIPVLNEAASLEQLHRELADVAVAEAYEMEIIFVDDGSSDGSWEAIRRLAEGDPRVQGLRFRRNFGKAAALSAGFAQARGELVMTLDADLQDDPREIPRFLAAMQRDLDCVSGWKKIRHDPWHKVFPSRVFNALVSRLTGVKLHDHNCGMKCYRREIFDEVQLYGELHRFVPVLAASRGYRIGEIEIKHRPRRHGRSKYGVARFIKGFLDLLTVKFLTGFGQRPQHVLGAAGLLFFSLGVLGLFYLAGQWIVTRWVPGLEPRNIHERALMYYSIASLLMGGQLMSIGFLAELFIAYHHPRMKSFSICEKIGGAALKQSIDEEKAKTAGD